MSVNGDKRYVGEMHSVIIDALASTPRQCLFHDRTGKRCRAEAIQSHSLQRGGPLASISELGHVTKIGQNLRAQPIEKRGLFERIGLANASIFPGFCGKHDSELFSEVEAGELKLCRRTAVIIAIRAMAMELYKKVHMVQLQSSLVSHLQSKDQSERAEIPQLIRTGAKSAILENTRKLEGLFRWYYKEPPPNFLVVGWRFEKPAPFASSGAFEPEWDLRKKPIYLVHPLSTKWNSVHFFSGNIGGTFHSIYCGLQMYKNHRIDRFLRQLDGKAIDTSTLFTLSVGFSENCFAQESWISKLSTAEISLIAALQRSGLLEGIRDPNFLDWKVTFPKNEVIERYRSWD